MVDRRDTAFNDPRFWVSVTAILLTISLAVLGFIATQLSSISSDLRAMVVATNSNTKEIESLRKDLTRLEGENDALKRLVDDNEKTQRDYNFKMSNDMQKIITLYNLDKK